MNVAADLRAARERSGLTQAQLARTAGTSQATVSAYEGGTKTPSLDTLGRLLSACGARLTIVPGAAPVREPTRAELAHAGATLVQVLELAAHLPVRHDPDLRFPRLPA